jgi:hypothetical protein
VRVRTPRDTTSFSTKHIHIHSTPTHPSPSYRWQDSLTDRASPPPAGPSRAVLASRRPSLPSHAVLPSMSLAGHRTPLPHLPRHRQGPAPPAGTAASRARTPPPRATTATSWRPPAPPPAGLPGGRARRHLEDHGVDF